MLGKAWLSLDLVKKLRIEGGKMKRSAGLVGIRACVGGGAGEVKMLARCAGRNAAWE